MASGAGVLLRLLDDASPKVVVALGVIGGAEAVPALEALAHGRARVTSRDVWADERLRRVARRALARAGSGAEAALTPWWKV